MNGTLTIANDTDEAGQKITNDTTVEDTTKAEDSRGSVFKVSFEEAEVDKYLKDEVEMPSHVRKMIEVIFVTDYD